MLSTNITTTKLKISKYKKLEFRSKLKVTHMIEVNHTLDYLYKRDYQAFFNYFTQLLIQDLPKDDLDFEILRRFLVLKNIAEIINKNSSVKLFYEKINVISAIKLFVKNDLESEEKKLFDIKFNEVIDQLSEKLSNIDREEFNKFLAEYRVIDIEQLIPYISRITKNNYLVYLVLFEASINNSFKKTDLDKFLLDNMIFLNEHPIGNLTLSEILIKINHHRYLALLTSFLAKNVDKYFYSSFFFDELQKIVNYKSKYQSHELIARISIIAEESIFNYLKNPDLLALKNLKKSFSLYFKILDNLPFEYLFDREITEFILLINKPEIIAILDDLTKSSSIKIKKKLIGTCFKSFSDFKPTLIKIAIDLECRDFLKLINQSLFDESIFTEYKIETLQYCIESSKYKSFQIIFENYKVDKTDQFFCPLLYSLKFDRYEIAEYVLEQFIPELLIYNRDYFYYIILSENQKLLNLLLIKFPEISVDQFMELIEIAINFNNSQAIISLVKFYEDLHDLKEIFYFGNAKINPLMISVALGHLECSQTLVDLGLDVNFKNEDSDLISISILTKNHEMLKILAQNGLSISAENSIRINAFDPKILQEVMMFDITNKSDEDIKLCYSRMIKFIDIYEKNSLLRITEEQQKIIDQLRSNPESYRYFNEIKVNLMKALIIFNKNDNKKFEDIICEVIRRETDLSLFTISSILILSQDVKSFDFNIPRNIEQLLDNAVKIATALTLKRYEEDLLDLSLIDQKKLTKIIDRLKIKLNHCFDQKLDQILIDYQQALEPEKASEYDFNPLKSKSLKDIFRILKIISRDPRIALSKIFKEKVLQEFYPDRVELVNYESLRSIKPILQRR
jgi:ankyrin repeat protein